MPRLGDRDILLSVCLPCLFLEFSAFEGKIEAPLTHVLAPGASIRENTVVNLSF